MTTRTLSFIGLLVLGIYLLIAPTQILFSATPSLPQKVFFMVKGLRAQKGDLVTISGHKTAYFPEKTIYTKRLVGVAGDHISRKDQFITIKGQTVSPLKTHTHQGEPLTPLDSQVIPEGYVFVMASHPRSFDSRYKEFGLVKEESILGKTWGLF